MALANRDNASVGSAEISGKHQKVEILFNSSSSSQSSTSVSSSSESSSSSSSESSSSSSSTSSTSISSSSTSSSSSESCYVSPYSDDFTGTNGDPPNVHNWNPTGSTQYMSIQSNKLNFNSPGDNATYITRAISRFDLVGDFDIQIDFDITSLTQPDSSTSHLAIFLYQVAGAGGANVANVFRVHQSGAGVNGYDSNGTDSGGFDAYNDNDSTGKLRLTRVSGQIKCFIWSGSQWEWNGNTAGRVLVNNDTSDIVVRLRFKGLPVMYV